MEDVYPYVKHYARKKGVDFSTSDIDWGIKSEPIEDHKARLLCRDEIQRCADESAGMSCVLLAGDKYGFRPFPVVIDQEEFELLKDRIDDEDPKAGQLLDEWFPFDENDNTYKLSPAQEAKDKGAEWAPIYEHIQIALRNACEVLPEERQALYTASAVEQNADMVLANGTKAVFINRSIPNLSEATADSVASLQDRLTEEDMAVDEGAQKMLQSLKTKLDDNLDDACVRNVTVNTPLADILEMDRDGSVTATSHHRYLREFADLYCHALVEDIDRAAVAKGSAFDPVYEEVKVHNMFGRGEAAKFIDIQSSREPLQAVTAYLTNEVNAPFIVHGSAGSGKTSMLAKVVSCARDVVSSDNAEPVIVARFLGNTADSTHVFSLLKSISIQIVRAYGGDAQTVPDEWKPLLDAFPTYLAMGTAKHPLLVFLDSLEQLSEANNAWQLGWLPMSWNQPHLKFVLSTDPDPTTGILDKLRAKIDSGSGNFAPMEALEAADGELMLTTWLTDANRTLTEGQKAEVLDTFAQAPSPLFLRIAFEISRGWHSFDEPSACSLPTDFKSFEDGVPALMSTVFEQLRRNHGGIFVDQALGVMTEARNGISTNELEDILSLNDDVLSDIFEWWTPPVRRLPPVMWTKLAHDLKPFLFERGADGGVPLWVWSHKQWHKAAVSAFVDPEKGTNLYNQQIHQQIAEYFSGKWASTTKTIVKKPFRNKKGGTGEADRHVQSQPLLLSGSLESSEYKCNVRKLNLLPYHTSRGGLWKVWVEVLTDLNFIAAKCALEDGVQDLLQDYSMKKDLPDDLEVNTSTGEVIQM